ncbi:hypothetical protein GCM10009802_40690 [Streptomyces synnematoformans]|uniref:Nucleotidyltransferase n=1 Tax=Streptomyces synnematoformans TaxID=415721 RepID=A0ABN2YUI7_9ACTN
MSTAPDPAALAAAGLPDLAPALASPAHPLVFATVSGAHLYGFPSRDSDVDLRGAHLPTLTGLWGDVAGAPGVERLAADVAALRGALDEAQGRTPLPDAPEGRAELGEIVVDARLQLG